ncbi:MAG: hypothetical protein HGA49_11985, partial [Eubacteriaceae bacterium]|nr:hypothetical protein [Eubacteriaceae bacterium]
MIKAFFFILVAAFTAYLFYTQSQTKEIIVLLNSIDILYIYGALFCMLAYLIINTSVIYIIAHNISGKIKFFSAFYLSSAGQYYGMLTPMGSGTQPAQIMILKNKYEIDYSKGTSITIKQYIIYQIAVSIISLIMFVSKYDFFVAHYPTYMIFIYL